MCRKIVSILKCAELDIMPSVQCMKADVVGLGATNELFWLSSLRSPPFLNRCFFCFFFQNASLSAPHLAPLPSFLLAHGYEGSGALSLCWRGPGLLKAGLSSSPVPGKGAQHSQNETEMGNSPPCVSTSLQPLPRRGSSSSSSRLQVIVMIMLVIFSL